MGIRRATSWSSCRAEEGFGEGDFEAEVEDFSGVFIVALEVVGGAAELADVVFGEDG